MLVIYAYICNCFTGGLKHKLRNTTVVSTTTLTLQYLKHNLVSVTKTKCKNELNESYLCFFEIKPKCHLTAMFNVQADERRSCYKFKTLHNVSK